MKHFFVTFRSVTYAQRGESLLKQAGIRCELQRTPRRLEEQGCGYGLRLRARDLPQALELMKQKQVQYRKVYVQHENGETEVVQL